MLKKSLLSFVLLALAVAFAPQAYSLGLGNLDVNSYLEQPLDISLPLVITQNDDLNTLVVSAATQAEFDSANILRQDFVDDLSFEIVRTGGAPYIKITSKQPVNDPFIHLLIRFKWNGGELLREYTALIDPPVYASASPTPVASPKSVAQETSETVSDAQLAANTDNAAAVNTSVDSADSGLQGDTYGPISAGESLSMIAKKIQSRYPDLSIYQIMYVLYRNNQSAFIDDNINQLIKGSLLKVGDAAQIRAVDVNDGKELFYEHLSRWTQDNAVNQQSANSQQEGVKVTDDVQQPASAPSASTSSSTEAVSEVAEDSEFKVGASDLQSASQLSDSSSEESAKVEVELLKQQLAEAESKLSSSILENNELQERINLLEEQLASVNKLIELESVSGSKIVDGIVNTNQAGADSGEPENEELSTEPLSAVGTDSLNDAQKIIDESADAVSTPDTTTTEADNVVETNTVETNVVETTPAPETTIESEYGSVSFFDKVASFLGFIWKYLLGAIAALLLIVFGLRFAKQRRAESSFEEDVSGISDMELDTKTESTSMSADFKTAETTVTKESSFLTVYSDSEVVVHADEIDPIAEADVYIAYGRDEQGEEVLLEGIRKFPNRPDIKVSLLKLHMKRKDITKFDALAEELYDAGENDNPDIWNRVVEMGSVLSPDNPLYSVAEEQKEEKSTGIDIGAAASATAAIAAAASEAESLLDDDVEADFDELDLDIESTQQTTVTTESSENNAATVENELISDAKDDVDAASKSEDYDVDFENVDFSIGTDITVNVDDDMLEISLSDDTSYDDVLEEGELDVPNVVEFDNYEQTTETEVEVELGEDEYSERSTQEIVEEAIAREVTRDADLEPNVEGSGVDFDEPLSIQLEDVTLDVTADAEVADPNTQLELAKVFIELDDVSGAKEILDTLAKGDDADVKKEAAELLKSLKK